MQPQATRVGRCRDDGVAGPDAYASATLGSIGGVRGAVPEGGQDDMADESSQPSATGTRLRIGGYLAICLVFVIASLASGLVLHAAARAVGANRSGLVGSAWFSRPVRADIGYRPGTAASVMVVGAPRGAVGASCGQTPLTTHAVLTDQRGHVRYLVPIPAACSHRWLLVQVDGLAHPLKAWVR